MHLPGDFVSFTNMQKEGNDAVLQLLRDSDCLLHEEDYLHRYPYDWRSKKPVIVRATDQWFASVANLAETAQSELEKVQMLPVSGI